MRALVTKISRGTNVVRWIVIAAVLAGCGSQASVDWSAVEDDIVKGWPSAFVAYFAEDNELVVQVDPGTAASDAVRIACDLAVPAVEHAGGNPDSVTISVFERGADEVLFEARRC